MKRFLILAVALVLLVTGCQSKAQKAVEVKRKERSELLLFCLKRLGLTRFSANG